MSIGASPGKLRIAAERQYLPENAPPCALLAPFWGGQDDDPITGTGRIFARYQAEARALFELASPDTADVALVPANWEHYARQPDALERLRILTAEAARAARPLLVFYRGDYEAPIQIEGAADLRLFRTSLTRATRRPGEETLPAWSVDFLEAYNAGHLDARPWQAEPVIGFCGDMSSGNHPLTRLRRLVGQHPARWRLARRLGINLIAHPGARLRAHAIHSLRRAPGVACNFVLRYGYWNGAVYRGKVLSEQSLDQSRAEYVQNMRDSDYVLCIRGKGNYSYRFYEALSFGRIPVVVDTGGVLPFEPWIDWPRYGVWVPEADLPHIGAYVQQFHARLTPADFHDLQHACRQLWDEWLSPHGFFRNLHRYFSPQR